MSESRAVYIMGAGRMGSILARAMSQGNRVTIYQRDEATGRQVAAEIGCAYDQPANALPTADVVILALPTEATAPALASIRGLLKPDAVVINIATKVLKDSLRPLLNGACHLVGAKIVGQFRGMEERPVIVIDADTGTGQQAASALFACLGTVQPGDERTVQFINTLTARESFRAAIHIQDALQEAGVSAELINSALRVVAVGSLKAYAAQDMGPFGRDILRELRSAEGAK